MEKQLNKYISVAYKLYVTEDGKQELVEEATDSKPFLFISGFGIALEAFEKNVVDLAEGEEFDFTLAKEDAYGDFMDERVIELDRSIFCVNGHFDHENIYIDAMVPLQNNDGNRFYGRVMKITDSKVMMDLNHPLAGKELTFKGHVVESREATKDEIQGLINRISGEGCGCGCDDCGGHNHDCGCGGHDHNGGCGHHHSHEDGHHCHDGGCGCGHCH